MFNGDPIRYREWFVEFQTIIETHVQDNLVRLCYLKRYTTGLAREAIDGYLQISDSSCYDKAQALLKSRFGDPSLIAGQYRRKLEFWEALDDENCSGSKLRQFSDFLDTCNMLKSGQLQSEFSYWDSPVFIKASILRKIPASVSKAWHKRISNNIPINKLFSTLTDCLRESANQMCQPAYIYPGSPLYESIQSEIDKSPKCQYCKSGSHKLQRCGKLQNLSVKDQRNFIQKVGLCYQCLGKGHKSTSCKSPVRCTICHMKHPTSLHRWKPYNKHISDDLETPNGLYDDYRKSTYNSLSTSRNKMYADALAQIIRGLGNHLS